MYNIFGLRFPDYSKMVNESTGEIHIGSEGELHKYINHHVGTPTKARRFYFYEYRYTIYLD